MRGNKGMENKFIFKVEDEFYIKGRGTVIVGKDKGPVRVGEELVSLTGEKIKFLLIIQKNM